MNILYKNDVIKLGEEPYLFLHQHKRAQRQFDLFTGKVNIKESCISNFIDNYNYSNDISSNEFGAKYVHVVFPAKIPVFRDLFSKFGVEVRSIFPMFSKYCPDVLYHEELNYSDFYIQDTHNSDHGKIKIIDQCLNHFNIEIICANKLWGELSLIGDLGKKLGEKPIVESKLLGIEGEDFELRSFSNRKGLSGNSGELSLTLNRFENMNRGVRKLALFGDSFAKSCIKYLSYYFDQILYVRSPFVIRTLAKNFQPTHIITSNAERYLSSVPLWQEKEQDVLSMIKSSLTKLEDEAVKSTLKKLVRDIS